MTKEALSLYLYFIVEKVIPLIMSEYKLNEEEAISKFYCSKLYSFLENPKTGVWRFSPKLLFSLYKDELEKGYFTFPEEAA
ncbi:MAG: hypothetical protein FWC26_00020 [Fibromonadales bacterium]|nr:hypothetical protein [Fibromonadales bacterium]